jgi:monofunctional biosynthetic peptidoglycan transglycosylase
MNDPEVPVARPEEDAPRPRRRRRGCRRWLAAAALLTLAWLGWTAATWPDVAALATENPETTAFIERYEARQRRAGASDAAAWTWVPYGRISPHLKRAVLVSEDIGFFDHHGFAGEEIREALRTAWREREAPRGASTLTQQVAKNLWLTPSYNPLRKLEEALLTRQLECHLDKRRILEIYLNVAEFGPGIYGAEAAARHYFGTSAAGLGERQAAELAAALPRPRTWHPGAGGRGYQRHVERIRRRMEKAAWLWRVI